MFAKTLAFGALAGLLLIAALPTASALAPLELYGEMHTQAVPQPLLPHVVIVPHVGTLPLPQLVLVPDPAMGLGLGQAGEGDFTCVVPGPGYACQAAYVLAEIMGVPTL